MSQDKTGSNYAANYHVPINREWLDVVIPAKNEIIYSTNMNIQYKIQNLKDLKSLKIPVAKLILLGGLSGIITAALVNPAYKNINRIINTMDYVLGDYNTDALITHEGIALNLPSFELNKRGKLKKLPLNPQYVLWRKISFSKNGTLIIESVFNCELIRKWDPEFETEEEFINRRESFYEIVTNLRYSYTAECLKSARTSLDLNDNGKALEWIERGFNSNVYRFEFDYADELDSLKAQIVKEESENKLKMVEEIDKFLVKYLQSNAGKAFTKWSIMKRLVDELDNREWLEYLEKNIEGVLIKLTFNGAIKSKQLQRSVFFFS